MKLKKLLSILLCLALLLCFAGCSKDKEEDKPRNDNEPAVSSIPETAGVLFLSIGTEFKVVYDTDGNVMAVDAINETAAELLTVYDDAIGKPCSNIVSDLIKRSIDAGKHPYTRTVVIKQAPDSESPSAAFMENIRIAAAAVTDYEVVLILCDSLTEEGYITADQAKDILTRQLKLVNTSMNCTLADGEYTLTFEVAGAEQEYKVSAVSGTVELDSLPSDISVPEVDYNDPLDMGGQVDEPMDMFSDPEYDNYQDSPLDENN